MEPEVMSKIDLVNVIENVELSKTSSNYNMKFWMVVVSPLLMKLGYPIFDSTKSMFNENLMSIKFDIDGKAKDEELKIVYSLSPLKELQKTDELDGVDYVVVILTDKNEVKFYTYGMGEFHILNDFNIKTVENNRYNTFFNFLKYSTLSTMYTKHGKKLVTSSLLDRMFKLESLASNLFVQQALKDLFQSPPDELYKLISDYLFANYTFKSPTNIIKDLKESKGTLLDAFNNLDSGGYTSIFDESVTSVKDDVKPLNKEDLKEDYNDTSDFGFDYNAHNDKEEDSAEDKVKVEDEKEIIESKNKKEEIKQIKPKKDIKKIVENKEPDIVEEDVYNEDIDKDNIKDDLDDEIGIEISPLEDETDDFAVGVYEDGLSGGLDSLLDDDDTDDSKSERNIAKRTNNLNDILKL